MRGVHCWQWELLPVAGFGGDDVSDAAAGVRNVAGVARNDVEVELRHGLALRALEGEWIMRFFGER